MYVRDTAEIRVKVWARYGLCIMRVKYKGCKRRSASAYKIKLDVRSRVQCSRQKC